MDCFLGIDLGTSGCRICAIEPAGREIAQVRCDLPPSIRTRPGWSEQNPEVWWDAVRQLLGQLSGQLADYQIRALSVDGTSGTLLLTDHSGIPLGPALMYDDCRATGQAQQVAALAPGDNAGLSPTASLPKLLWMLQHAEGPQASHALHQAEWISGKLMGKYGLGDENNCLKLGFDPVTRCWPEWLAELGIERSLLPEVRPVGTPLGELDENVARLTGLPRDCLIVAGTTDSTAATLAADVSSPGDAVTSLGSTLVLKLISDQPVFAARFGVYSHRVFDRWLVGGASNTGGAVLKRYFSEQEMRDLSARLRPEQPSGLDYYPLPRPGERFPHNDPNYPPRIEPVPNDRSRFFQGLLEGIARIERDGYALLQDLGAASMRRIITTGGGSRNTAWTRIRERLTGLPISTAVHEEAAYGSALIAHRGFRTNTRAD